MKTRIVASFSNFMKTGQAQSPPAASPQPSAPLSPVLLDELMVEILSWLPVKSLLKFRCVCKSWKSLISDPKFVKLHLRSSATKANLLLVWGRKPFCDFLVPCPVRSLLGNPSSSTIDEEYCFPLNGGDDNCYEVIGSCNGLVCMLGISHRRWFPEYYFYLCNPATKLTSKDFARLHVGDSFNYYRFAFGYDKLNDTYKVIAFMFNGKVKEESQKNQVKICGLGDKRWRDVHSFPVITFYNVDNPGHNNGVYFNGTLNWLALCNINSAVIAQFVIVSLDLGKEKCTQLLLPRLDEALPVDPTIGVLMDCLCFSHDFNRSHFVVWQMKEFGVEKSWTQFMRVSYENLQFDCLEYPLIPLCTSDNGDVLIMVTVAEMQAILYHRRDNRVERTKLPKYIHWYCTLDYAESLVSPCCNLQP